MIQDKMLRLMLGGDVSGYMISANNLVDEARRVHGLSRVCTAALGRQLLMTAMMTAQLKHESESLTTILRGGGPAGNLVATGRYGALVKGYVINPHIELPLTSEGKIDVGGAVGREGRLSVIRDMRLGEPYAGECAMVSGEVAEDFAAYFATSEQCPSLVYLGVRLSPCDGAVRAAGGLFLQALPGCSDKVIDALQLRSPFIEDISLRLDDGETMHEIATSIFRGLDLVLSDAPTPKYSCDCSRERMERALIALGKQELCDMIRDDYKAELTCHFCNSGYTFTGEQLETLLCMASAD